MILTEYPSSLTRLLTTPPAPGEGHRWLFRVAVRLRNHHPREAVKAFLRQACNQCITHRAIPDRELEAALADAYAFQGDGTINTFSGIDWYDPDPARIATVAMETRPLFAPGDRTGIPAAAALQALFQPADLVCLAGTQATARVMPAADAVAGGLVDKAQFIVPSPMRALAGVNKAGRPSVRCDSNVRPRRFLVLEFDDQDKETQSRILSHLAGMLPLVLAVDSAGKSLHGWFRVEGVDDYTLRDWMTYAIGLGADPHTWVRSQLVRCPGGLRIREGELPARQEIVFWNR